MGKIKFAKTISPLVHYENRFYIWTEEGPGSIPYGQYLDRTLGKFPPIYGPHLQPFINLFMCKIVTLNFWMCLLIIALDSRVYESSRLSCDVMTWRRRGFPFAK